ncbi:Metallo-dependent phosphatase-like protein [Gamsiella multidivaricata]|uniref:Metallo-dependent phosphatase-like protein n=1 Tax=Gamsiella multidivaricata TaxID=101098 RepID=UPI00221EFC01|nr:Metallo-dependent phosphatase-like protein [Gamsiella multidivaricata]KAI7826568.1 Metallo-dependent phosphatase-like protein [Gamsiella multidivaricata]
MRLLTLLPLLAATVAAHGLIEKRVQPGAPQPDPVDLKPLIWGDVNIIQTTDTHGWLSGNTKEESYSADFGDFASFLFHMRQQANHRRKDLLVVDSGDLHDGNGFSDATPLDGQDSNPIFEKINYDVLAIGNHELYVNAVAEDTYKNFAPKWGRRYVTSNVFFKDGLTNKTVPLGNLYNKFRMKFGTRVMSYGFLFNFNGNANNTVVEAANVTVSAPWFQKTLKEDVDLYLIAGHVPIRWTEAVTVVNAIRAAHPSKPIVLMGGHLHIRDFKQYDERAVGMASGRFMETVGWLSVDGVHDRTCYKNETVCVGKNLTVTRRYLDNNVYTFKTHSLAHPKQKFDTWRGSKITKEITQIRQSLNLSNALGCAPQDYYLSRYPVTDTRSLLNLLANEVLPIGVVNASRPNPAQVIINSGSQRFDLLKGPFTIDDTYIVSPFHDDFVYATLPYKVAKNIVGELNNAPIQKRAIPPPPTNNVTLTPGYVTNDDYGYGGDDWPHAPIPYVNAPNYIASPLSSSLGDNDLVDVIWLSFFSNLMGPILKKLDSTTSYTPVTYRSDINTNTMYLNFVKTKWGNNKC